MLSNNTDYKNSLLNRLAYVDLAHDWEPGDDLYTVVKKTGNNETFAEELKKAGFGDYVIKDYQNDNSTNGFAAISFENPDTGEVGMSFRGTENLENLISDFGGIVTGDEETINSQIDMLDNGSTAIAGDSVQRREAIEFFERNRSHTGQNYLYGHSKGGELASQVYAKYHMLINEVHVINPQPINPQVLTEEQIAAFNNGKFDAIVVDGDLVWKLGDAPYSVRIVKNNGSQDGFFGPHAIQSVEYDNENAVIEEEPYKDYFWQKITGDAANFAISNLQGLYNYVSTVLGKSTVFLTRDFSEASRQKLLGLVSDVENEKLCDFTDWAGDRWYDFEDWIGTLDIRCYINDVNSYHKKVLDKNNTSKSAINEIFDKVHSVDLSYKEKFTVNMSALQQVQRYTDELGQIVDPANGIFSENAIVFSLNPLLAELTFDDIEAPPGHVTSNAKIISNTDFTYNFLDGRSVTRDGLASALSSNWLKNFFSLFGISENSNEIASRKSIESLIGRTLENRHKTTEFIENSANTLAPDEAKNFYNVVKYITDQRRIVSEIEIAEFLGMEISEIKKHDYLNFLANQKDYTFFSNLSDSLDGTVGRYLDKVEDIENVALIFGNLLNDYTEDLEYLEKIETAMIDGGYDQKVVRETISKIEWEYNNKVSNAIVTGVKTLGEKGGEKAVKKTLPYVDLMLEAKDVVCEVSGLNGYTENLEMIYATQHYSYALVEKYDHYADKIRSGDYTQEDIDNCNTYFKLARNAKIQEYESIKALYQDALNDSEVNLKNGVFNTVTVLLTSEEERQCVRNEIKVLDDEITRLKELG